jgi:hypothetical protein
MEDLWEMTEYLECEMCGGLNDCRFCGELYPIHAPDYTFRILIQLGKYQMPADELLEFVAFMDERNLWRQVGHWTICVDCKDLRIDLKDYAIHHHMYGNLNTLKVWQGRDSDRIQSYNECQLVHSVSWRSKPI